MAKRAQMLDFLAKSEGNLLAKDDDVKDLLRCKEDVDSLAVQLIPLKASAAALADAKRSFSSAARHAVSMYKTIQKLRRISPVYQYSLNWFSRILCTSIDNSSKSRDLEKRMRYVKDHLTYSLFCRVICGLLRRDRLLFALLLSCRLLVNEGQLDERHLNALPAIWRLNELKERREPAEICGEKPEWMDKHTFAFFLQMEEKYEEFRGLCEDFKASKDFWMTLRDAKEPDNLPLKEPWYSSLPPVLRLVVIAALRTDKLTELVESFVSDHVGFKVLYSLGTLSLFFPLNSINGTSRRNSSGQRKKCAFLLQFQVCRNGRARPAAGPLQRRALATNRHPVVRRSGAPLPQADRAFGRGQRMQVDRLRPWREGRGEQ